MTARTKGAKDSSPAITTANDGAKALDLGGLVDEVIANTQDGAGSNRIAGVEVIDRYPDTNRVRRVRVEELELSDHQYRRFLALRRGALASGTAANEIDLGALAGKALELSAQTAARRIPGAEVAERDELGRPTTWTVEGRTISQRQYVRLRKLYFAK